MLASRDLWTDELNQIQHTLGPLRPFWQKYHYGDATYFPGDCLLTYPFVQIFHYNKWGLAIPHIILTVVGFIFLYKICQKYLSTLWGFAVAFLVICLNSNLIFHQFELRAYAVLPTISLVCFYLLKVLFDEYEGLSLFRKVGYGFVLLLCIWYNLSGMITILLLSLFFILDKKKDKNFLQQMKKPITFLILVILISLPLWLIYASGTGVEKGHLTFRYIPNPGVDLLGFAKSIFGNLIGNRRLYFLLGFMLSAFFIPHKGRLNQIGFFFTLVILPITSICLAMLLLEYWFLQRQFIWVIPFFAFLLGWCVESTILFVKNLFGINTT